MAALGASAAAVVAVAAVLLSGACDSSEGSDNSETATPSATVLTATATTKVSPTPGEPVTPTATPSPGPEGIRYTVVEGDTLFDIALRFDVKVEAIVAANGLTDPAAISVGQVLVIPVNGVIITPTPGPTDPPPDPRLRGFTVPIAGACLPSSGNLMPNAPREYRSGVHEGVDFYTGYNCVPVNVGEPALSVKPGTVIRADHGFVEMTLDELNSILARTQAQGYTDPEALDKFRGRQVWVDHGEGIVTRYCHLGAIPEGIGVGTTVGAGQPVGFVGDSGTPEAVTNPGVEIHLHWEVRVGDSYLGAGQPADLVRSIYERLFAP